MAVTLLDSATVQIKSGIAYLVGNSGGDGMELAFPISDFRVFVAGCQRELNDFDHANRVIPMTAPARTKGGRR